ncbi:hypothetical protein C0J52_08190 [Blattella germanica]|nr:hypothetical protein C0J52_08190 [Blattella germanica]
MSLIIIMGEIKMAESVVQCLESALRIIEKNAGTTGYLSKDMKENIQQAHRKDDKTLTFPKKENKEKGKEVGGDEEWELVKSRRQRTKRNTLGGTRIPDDGLQAADKKAWLYIGKLKKNTSEMLTKHLVNNGIQGEITCEELNTLGDTKAFKVSIPLHHLKETELPNFWPMGIRVRRFRFRKTYRDEGVYPE